MALLQWKDQYSVGIEAVDYEHKELIDLINRLYAEFSATGLSSSVDAFFGDLLRAISAHFALEERFMTERNYNQLAQHKADHERLLDELRDIMDGDLANDDLAGSKLPQRLDAWFSRHFETHDARLHKAFGAHQH
jgi:hemerythrin-like metal-binding protein